MACQKIKKGIKKVFYRGEIILRKFETAGRRGEKSIVMFTNCKLLLHSVNKKASS